MRLFRVQLWLRWNSSFKVCKKEVLKEQEERGSWRNRRMNKRFGLGQGGGEGGRGGAAESLGAVSPLTQWVLGLTPVILTRTQQPLTEGRRVHLGWGGGGCGARQKCLWNQQRWHVLTGAKRKTLHVGCKRSPHQKSVMYAKLCHYGGRTNGWGWCNCLKQGISLSLMSWASVMGLFTLLSWRECRCH